MSKIWQLGYPAEYPSRQHGQHEPLVRSQTPKVAPLHVSTPTPSPSRHTSSAFPVHQSDDTGEAGDKPMEDDPMDVDMASPQGTPMDIDTAQQLSELLQMAVLAQEPEPDSQLVTQVQALLSRASGQQVATSEVVSTIQ